MVTAIHHPLPSIIRALHKKYNKWDFLLCQEKNQKFEVNLPGELEAVPVLHHDEIGVIAEVSHVLAEEKINIAGTSDHRREKGDEALFVVEADGRIPPAITKRPGAACWAVSLTSSSFSSLGIDTGPPEFYNYHGIFNHED
jgi:hypothetical protein